MAERCDMCGCKVDRLGLVNTDIGSYCGLCECQYVQNRSSNKHLAKFRLLASRRSTSDLQTLVRNDLLLRKLMDMLIGPNELVQPKYAKRLKRANLKRTLTGRQYGYRPIFVLLYRVWIQTRGADLDCLDKVIDFIVPLEDALMTWKWNSLRYSERTRRRWHEHFTTA